MPSVARSPRISGQTSRTPLFIALVVIAILVAAAVIWRTTRATGTNMTENDQAVKAAERAAGTAPMGAPSGAGTAAPQAGLRLPGNKGRR